MAKLVSLEHKEIDELLALVSEGSLRRKLEKARKTIKTSSAKAKGRGLQQWVCAEISKLTGIPYVQADDDSLIRSREMGQAGLDVILRGEASKLFPWSVECKATESFSLGATVEQVERNVKPGTNWLIVHRSKRFRDPIVVLSWEAFARTWEAIL